MRGEASGDGRVYQARRDQRIEQRDYTLNVFLDRGADAETYRGEADRIVTVLLHAVGSLEERCEALERKAVRARAAGRAEAYAEIQAELQESGLKLRSVQGKLKEAQQDREVAERLLTEARRAAEEYRREAEELRLLHAAPEQRDEPAAEPGLTLDEYDRFIDTADAELAALRVSLERLGDEMSLRGDGGADGRVVAGEVAGQETTYGLGTMSPAGNAGDAGVAVAGVVVSGVKVTVPKSALPEGAAPEGAAPEGAAPDGAAPEGAPAKSGRAKLGTDVGFWMGTPAFLLSNAALLLAGVSIREMYASPHGPAVMWGVVYVLGSLVGGHLLGSLLKVLALMAAGCSGDYLIEKWANFTLFAPLPLIYALCLPASLGPWVSTAARFIAQGLGPV
ncbi:DUF3267 domain-containing protein [Streptomyces sp. NBC_00083]|uniref:DUF3267 domain-containing protein n=1 Tax=Streptomyces sp. NBC_00083 TaxID=2975647 RepID=UPI002258B53E|nr:DUF3267 domain-containing protein [Streptomyces sp. NBC_00083]MCX5385308.1 DUF3267 domain-containing protein [Streptomyces sp. NBC_00083]